MNAHDANAPRPTDGELQILTVLWRLGPSTVREVFDAMPEKQTGYTTVLKLMQIMAEKGLVSRDESQRSHVYAPLAEAGRTRRRLVAELLDRAFSGSAAELVQSALSAKKASPAELSAISKMIDAAEAREKSSRRQK
jgi:predicted transcriptional regulator